MHAIRFQFTLRAFIKSQMRVQENKRCKLIGEDLTPDCSRFILIEQDVEAVQVQKAGNLRSFQYVFEKGLKDALGTILTGYYITFRQHQGSLNLMLPL